MSPRRARSSSTISSRAALYERRRFAVGEHGCRPVAGDREVLERLGAFIAGGKMTRENLSVVGGESLRSAIGEAIRR